MEAWIRATSLYYQLLSSHIQLVEGIYMLGALLWGKWGLFEPQGIQALKSSAAWCNGVARGVS